MEFLQALIFAKRLIGECLFKFVRRRHIRRLLLASLTGDTRALDSDLNFALRVAVPVPYDGLFGISQGVKLMFAATTFSDNVAAGHTRLKVEPLIN